MKQYGQITKVKTTSSINRCMQNFKDIRILFEGVYDPNIFKAFFLAGGPGSGKSFVTRQAFAGEGLRVINSDMPFERALKKAGLSLKMPDDEAEMRDAVRARAKATTATMMDLSLQGRLGIIIDGTAREFDKIKQQKDLLEKLGYDTYMIFVNTSLDVAQERNKNRDRSVPEDILKKSWQDVQSNMGKFQRAFGTANMVIVDNSKSDKELTTQTMNLVAKEVRKLLKRPVSNRVAKAWISKELEKKKR